MPYAVLYDLVNPDGETDPTAAYGDFDTPEEAQRQFEALFEGVTALKNVRLIRFELVKMIGPFDDTPTW